MGKTKWVSYFVLLTLGSLLCAGDIPLAQWLESFNNPVPEPGVQVENLSFSSSNLKLELTSGTAAKVMAGEEWIGIFFKGQGTLSYLSKDPTEAAVLKHNADQVGKVEFEPTEAGMRLSAPVKEVFIRAGGIPLPEFSGEPAASLEKDLAELDKFYGSVDHRPYAHLFAKQRTDNPQAPVVVVQADTGRNKLIYVLDMVEKKSERLIGLYKWIQQVRGGNNKLFLPMTLSEQPIERSRKDYLEPPFFLTDVTYTLVAHDNGEGELSLTETIVPLKRAQQILRFNQDQGIFDTNGKVRYYRVRSVKDEQGRSLGFHHSRHQLLVALAEPAPPNQPLKLQFEIGGDFLIRPNGDNFWQLGVEYWFPQPDLNGQFYTLHSTVKVQKPFVAFTPGVTLRREEEGDYNVVETKIDKPVQFAVVHAGKYSYEEKVEDGLTVRVASYAGKNKRAMEQLSNLSFQIIKFYERFLGPFPFKEFNIIEIQSYGFGQAPPGTMFITKEAFNPRSDGISKIFSEGINHRFAHEIAHQYWGHVIKMSSDEEQWLSESFAEYSSCFIVEMIKGKSGLKSLVRTWKTNAKKSSKISSIPYANRIDDPNDSFQSSIHRSNLIYSKGAYLLHHIHEEVGDNVFFGFLNNYQKLFAWKFGTTKDAVALLNHITKKDYGPLFEECFWGTGMPN